MSAVQTNLYRSRDCVLTTVESRINTSSVPKISSIFFTQVTNKKQAFSKLQYRIRSESPKQVTATETNITWNYCQISGCILGTHNSPHNAYVIRWNGVCHKWSTTKERTENAQKDHIWEWSTAERRRNRAETKTTQHNTEQGRAHIHTERNAK